jgi:hypothetical protein
VKDFVWWSGLTTTDARRGLEAVDLPSETVGGRTYWFEDARAPRGVEQRVDLVQCYDESIIAYAESRDVVLDHRLDRPFPGGQAPLSHAVLLDGRLAGLWRHRIDRSTARLEVVPLRGFADEIREALGDAARRYERFLGLPAGAVRHR